MEKKTANPIAYSRSASYRCFPAYIECQHCSRLFTWKNYPLILGCGHRICASCLENVYFSSENAGSPRVEVICYACLKNGATSPIYPNKGYDIQKFIKFHLNVDYMLLAHIYKHYGDEVEKNETPDAPIKEIKVERKRSFKKVEFVIEIKDIPSSVELETKLSAIIEEKKKVLADNDPATRIYKKLTGPEHKKYCCTHCGRVFNKRNSPCVLPCTHVICEYCLRIYLIVVEPGIFVLRCPMDDARKYFSLKGPAHYPCGSLVRRVVETSIKEIKEWKENKELLQEIYEKISIEAKKGAYEFEISNAMHGVELKERFCCHDCKNPFINSAAYSLPCGHHTCVECAQRCINAPNATGIKCSFDSEITLIDTGSMGKSLAILKLILPENKTLSSFVHECYWGEESFNPVSEDDGATVCPICFESYNSHDHLPYYMCKRKHSICKKCLAGMVAKKISSVKPKEEFLFQCATCQEKTAITRQEEKTPEDFLKLFDERASVILL